MRGIDKLHITLITLVILLLITLVIALLAIESLKHQLANCMIGNLIPNTVPMPEVPYTETNPFVNQTN